MTDYFKQKCPLFDAGLTPGDYLKLNSAGTKIQSTTTSAVSVSYIGKVSSDPDTGAWGATEEGYLWFNSTEKKFKGWNGTIIILIG